MRLFAVRCRICEVRLTKHRTGLCDVCRAIKTTHGNVRTQDSAYNSRRWRDTSKAYRQLHPLCINYDTCRGLATLVDHIKPIKQGGNMWDWHNYQPMCDRCHAIKRQSERGASGLNLHDRKLSRPTERG